MKQRAPFVLFLFTVVLSFTAGMPASASSSAAVPLQGTPVTGTVVDQKSQQPIAYVSVGVLETSTGTVSKEDGTFQLTIPANEVSKTIRISALGYEAKEIKAEALLSPNTTISLVTKPVQLAEVNVKAAKWKTRELGGNAGPFTLFHNAFTVLPRPLQENLGRELGVLIHAGDKQTFLSKLNFCLTSNQFDQVKFRVNLYSLKEGKPDQNLLPENIYVTVNEKKRGWIQVDLEPYNLYVQQDFILSLEWIDCSPRTESKALTLAAAMPAFQTIYHKDASQDKWEKMSAVGIGLNVVVQQEQ
ncbi:carboxypeptidase-like regulatory domain-containing protein [Rufibacter quisquiliarum]|uniref:Carboxypeptidase-like regulatory domain-containing protein n=1 Tax=Rufibacter quisquiliarum TaxID=1549639 RepID=A0A839GPY6_9BACT|nr:carboxypeptidase-like regulatory domain-containing protein [Rufibacter quisquiliarum]MBA9076946.1 hypothetical protein [Rufibacter quisquiliarum]